MTEAAIQPEAVVNHHIQAIMKRDLEAVISDYREDAVVFSPQGPVAGRDAIRELTASFMELVTDEFVKNFKTIRQDAAGEVVYVLWQVEGLVALGTDTFVVRDGKIAVQTFATQA